MKRFLDTQMTSRIVSAFSTLLFAMVLAAPLTDPAQAQTKTQPAPTQKAAQPQPETLPGGASALQETYQDWRIACGIVQNAKVCSISQIQAQQNGQRILAIELQKAGEGSVAGALVLPFGLKLEDGASLKIEGSPAPLASLRFSTCLPAGCLLPITFSAANISALRAGSNLTVTATPIDGSQPLALQISLKGFAEALDRLGQLQKS